MSIVHAAILGLVQGLAEFLPISSSGHLILTRILLGISDSQAATGSYVMLDLLLHGGTLIAIMVVFWRDWLEMLRNPFRSKTLLLLLIASLPALVTAVVAGHYLNQFFTGWFLGVSFLITACFLTLADTFSRREVRRDQQVGVFHALCMGVMQSIALLPGVSRSGSTIAGGLLSRLNKAAAAKFAFMMSAPAIVGGLIFEGKDAIEQGFLSDLPLIPVLVGVAVAAISGYFAIRFMLRIVSKSSLLGFALYVGMLGLVILVLQLAGAPFLPPFHFPLQ